MASTTFERRLTTLEAQVRVLKRATQRRVDLSIDEKNWKKVKPTAKKIRAKLYRARYA